MSKLGRKQMTLQLNEPLSAVPEQLLAYDLRLSDAGTELVYTYDSQAERTGITGLITELQRAGIHFTDLSTKQSSLEEIFVSLVRASRAEEGGSAQPERSPAQSRPA